MMVNFAKRWYIRPNYTSHKIFPAGTSKQKVFRIISSGAMRKEEGEKREGVAIPVLVRSIAAENEGERKWKKKKKKKKRRRKSLGTIPNEKERKGINRSRVRRRERIRIVPIR